ncbi:MAG: polysaccharide biosynthesis/export family protein [Acidobacteria bacterium]|nr:polysaccharide biosynthesis/export family protein [Acidobacteriota bacterium]
MQCSFSIRRRRPLLRRSISLLALSLACMTATALHAQFSGPALGSSTPVNQTISPTTDPAVLFPQNRDIRLGPGDVIGVHIYGATDYAPSALVSLDGSVQLPLIGKVQIQGLTIHEAEREIAAKLIDAGMYRNPQVAVQLTESPNQSATVSGELHGVVPIRGQRKLLDVLATAGGLPTTASHIITIQRPGLDRPIVVDLGTDPSQSDKANVPIFAGDTILVSRTGVVYVLGAFKLQGAVPLQQNSPLTLMQVAALSGGPGFEGKYGDLRLIRTVGLDRKVVHVNIKRVMDGKDPDPVLQVDDIVFLPSDAMKAAIKSGGISTLLGLASILVVAARP